MNLPPRALRLTLLALFTLSGFSGLIYESIWSHYLKLMLGHAAYAQTMVLAIFMGGMAIGAWWAGRRSERWGNPLVAYAGIEGAIGLFGLGFHAIFVWSLGALYEGLIPALGNPFAISAARWGVAGLLILPQSILLGMTFPLMSAGILRAHPRADGASLALLYFTNSLGAAAGALVSGFVLIGKLGLPGTMLTAAIINIVLALAVWMLGRDRSDPVLQREAPAGAAATRQLANLVAIAAFVTGLASFFYEIGWIRMLSLVLGSTNQAFELMLSAFILGLALGGLAIRKHIDSLVSPLRFAGFVQIAMGLLALATLPFYNSSFEFMGFMIQSLTKTEGGYAVFNLGSHAIALGIMLPATVMAGMTLPLFTHALIKAGHGEASIGRVYAANTVGAIAGVLIAVHFVMPMLGVKWLVSLGALFDVLLGMTLIAVAMPDLRRRMIPAAGGALAVVLSLAAGIQFDPLRMGSAVYRGGAASLDEGTEVLYQRDGKTASIGLYRLPEGDISIRTNGKPDANITPLDANPSPDEVTMLLLAAFPLALHPEARLVANVGLGSGLTTHALLGVDTIERVDTVEIERAMVEAARGYGERVERAFNDPRSRIHTDDAKTFFAVHKTRYDLIVSEPSNPWVSGVASLFSREFYADVGRHLKDDGLLVQWLQLYETNEALVASVFQALGESFPRYAVYNTDDSNIAIVASRSGNVDKLSGWLFQQPAIAHDLERIWVHSTEDLAMRRIGNRDTLGPLFSTYSVPPNSDYFPYLAQNSPKARFLGEAAIALSWMQIEDVPLVDLMHGRAPSDHVPAGAGYFSPATLRLRASALAQSISNPAGADTTVLPVDQRTSLGFLTATLKDCARPAHDETLVQESLFALASATHSYAAPTTLAAMWARLRSLPCYDSLSPLTQRWFTLHEAIGQRDFAEVAHSAEVILNDSDMPLSPAQVKYLLSAGLVAALSDGDPMRGQVFWHAHSARYPTSQATPIEMRMLLAMLSSTKPAGTKRLEAAAQVQ